MRHPSPSAYQLLDAATRAELRRRYPHRDGRDNAAIRIAAKRAARVEAAAAAPGVEPAPEYPTLLPSVLRWMRRHGERPHAGSHRGLRLQDVAVTGEILSRRLPRFGTARWFAAKGRAPDDVVPARTLRRRLRARAVQP